MFLAPHKTFHSTATLCIILDQNALISRTFVYIEMIDLAEESGVVKNLHERPAEQFASEYLEDRRSYILVDVKSKYSHVSYAV